MKLNPGGKLGNIEQEYEHALERLCEEVRAEVVLPFCRKHKLTYLAGNGSYSFYTGATRQIDDVVNDPEAAEQLGYPREEFDEIFKILRLDIFFGKQQLGSYLQDVT